MRRLWGITIETQAGGRALITMKLYSPNLVTSRGGVSACVCGGACANSLYVRT
jgi:hypothetical protein